MNLTQIKFNLFKNKVEESKEAKKYFHFISQKMYSTVHYIYIFTRLVTGSQRPIECNKVTLTCVRHINNKARSNKKAAVSYKKG